ncbi:Hypothetical protein, putative [Bodo saltans]|uniref:Uncharacterized protein n=1 Tax=Bodo saltans TaxID=75058 RepID=A0A0S4JR90_BODSA|nr:Hypothetical protein, putative [Bodo saltans]|eukprot:CUG93078.1 Hypothetical protein, putative [Bodo saltans]
MFAASVFRYCQQQKSAQLRKDLSRFVKPLAKFRHTIPTTSVESSVRYHRRCPVCNDDTLRDPANLDCHISLNHQSIEELCTSQVGPLAQYNMREVKSVCESSMNTDVVLVLDLANIELAALDYVSVTRDSPLVDFFSRYSVTCVLTHELMLPIAPAVAPDLFARLVTHRANSRIFTLFVSNGLDKGDHVTGALLQSLLAAPGVDGKILVMTNDGNQRLCLQLLHDRKRVSMLSFPRSPYGWGLILNDEMEREAVGE